MKMFDEATVDGPVRGENTEEPFRVPFMAGVPCGPSTLKITVEGLLFFLHPHIHAKPFPLGLGFFFSPSHFFIAPGFQHQGFGH